MASIQGGELLKKWSEGLSLLWPEMEMAHKSRLGEGFKLIMYMNSQATCLVAQSCAYLIVHLISWTFPLLNSYIKRVQAEGYGHRIHKYF